MCIVVCVHQPKLNFIPSDLSERSVWTEKIGKPWPRAGRPGSRPVPDPDGENVRAEAVRIWPTTD